MRIHSDLQRPWRLMIAIVAAAFLFSCSMCSCSSTKKNFSKKSDKTSIASHSSNETNNKDSVGSSKDSTGANTSVKKNDTEAAREVDIFLDNDEPAPDSSDLPQLPTESDHTEKDYTGIDTTVDGTRVRTNKPTTVKFGPGGQLEISGKIKKIHVKETSKSSSSDSSHSTSSTKENSTATTEQSGKSSNDFNGTRETKETDRTIERRRFPLGWLWWLLLIAAAVALWKRTWIWGLIKRKKDPDVTKSARI